MHCACVYTIAANNIFESNGSLNNIDYDNVLDIGSFHRNKLRLLSFTLRHVSYLTYLYFTWQLGAVLGTTKLLFIEKFIECNGLEWLLLNVWALIHIGAVTGAILAVWQLKKVPLNSCLKNKSKTAHQLQVF